MDENLNHREPTFQDDLVVRYCEEADTFLSTAADHVTALQMKDWLCKRFEEKCTSPLVRHATREYMEHKIRERWGNHGDHSNDKH